MRLPDVNYLAVLVSGVAIFVLGGLWYSPALFAKKWMALLCKTEAELKEKTSGAMPLLYLGAFICGTLSAWALAVVPGHITDLPPLQGALVGGLCWLRFAGATSFANALFSTKTKALWLRSQPQNDACRLAALICARQGRFMKWRLSGIW